MELPLPADIRVDAITRAILGDLDELAHQINHIRPLDDATLRQVRDELLAERVYNSNAIEGSTLTIRETRLILQNQSALDLPRNREADEALGLGRAASEIERSLNIEHAWRDVAKFLELHRLLMEHSRPDIAGVLRNRDVMIRGAKYQPPGEHLVSDLIDSFFGMLASVGNSTHGLILAAWAHWAIARIHPFEDGNGRLARLWQDFLLLRARYTVAIIGPQGRKAYLGALSRADDGDFNPLMQLIGREVIKTLQVYRNAQDAADLQRGWATELVGEAAARDTQEIQLEYQRWVGGVERLRDGFHRCAKLINEASDRTIEINIVNYDIIDQSTYEIIWNSTARIRQGFFDVFVRKGTDFSWFYFFLTKNEGGGPSQIAETPIAIGIHELYQGTGFRLPLDSVANSPIGLRELFVKGLRLARRRWNFDLAETTYDLDVDPVTVAQNFFEDVLLKRLR